MFTFRTWLPGAICPRPNAALIPITIVDDITCGLLSALAIHDIRCMEGHPFQRIPVRRILALLLGRMNVTRLNATLYVNDFSFEP